ncbi:MAG: DUF2167 domain-containing protein [Sphingomonas sp.]|nr:DUF2167 domain-containing protein [Sphingomonas sp.]
MVLALGAPTAAWADPKPAADHVSARDEAPAGKGVPPELLALEKNLHPQRGDVRIDAAKAVLHLGDAYYFLPADEAKRVLTQVWGNPPDAVTDVLGLVLPKDATIFENVWGAVVTYRDTGHVSDADANGQDYNKVLADMRSGEAADNAERREKGYQTITLVGWAQAPSYDAASHSLIWARELAGEGEPVHTLNYDVRLLGRTGVLSLNMIASMDSLAQVRGAAATFGGAVTFEKGATYADYDSSTDKTAEYGLAGLVAGGAAVAVAQKLGLLAIVLKFGKLILIGVAAGGAAVWAAVKRFFGGGRRDEDTI